MLKIYTYLILLALIMMSVPDVLKAQDLTWNGSVDTDFYNAQNWTPEESPGEGYRVYIGPGSPYNPVFSGDSNNERFSRINTQEGGELTIDGRLMTWGSDQLNGLVTIPTGRELNIRSDAFIGKEGTGRVDILGGAMYTKGSLYLGYGEGGDGTVFLEDGVLEPGEEFYLGEGGAQGKVILKGSSQFRIRGDRQAEVETWVQEGIMVPENENDEITWSYDAGANRTIITIFQDPNSLLKEYPNSIVLENDHVHAEINKSNAHITSYKLKGREMANDIYFSMDGGSNYTQPSNCVFSIKEQNEDFVDISLKSHWEEGRRSQAVDIDIHYVLEREGQGVYTYAILSHPEDYPSTGFSEWRMVWKLDQDQTEYICVDSLRHWEMPNSYDYENATSTGIPEIIKINTGVRAGKYDCKYDFNVEYWNIGTYGHASKKNDIGSWLVFGGYDYFNDGPTKQDLSAASGIIHVHFGMNHYHGSSTSLEAGEKWSKIYGPYKLYMNDGEGSVENLWDDAKAQAEAEKAKWPYEWLTDTPEYPLADGRGTVSGTFTIKDPYKSEVTGGGAMVGLAQHETGGNWQFESKNYQYWVEADAAGNFEIPDVRPGTYTLYAYSDGAVGEYKMENVQVSAGQNTAVGELTWEIPRNKGEMIWEIGVPDRTAREYFHGDDYFRGYIWETFSEDFANPLEYTIGESDWSTDWNYAHNGYLENDDWHPWKWNVNFDIDKKLGYGEATLTIAFAGAHYARMEVFVNDEYNHFARFYPSHARGNALIREGIHGKYSVYELQIPISMLKQGENTISLVQGRTDGGADHAMYDYISLEAPLQEVEEEDPTEENPGEENPDEEDPGEEDIITSLAEQRESEKLKVYPNPSQGKVSLEWQGNTADGVGIQILNSNGVPVIKKELDHHSWNGEPLQLDCNSLSPGVYYIRLQTVRSMETKKLIIRK